MLWLFIHACSCENISMWICVSFCQRVCRSLYVCVCVCVCVCFPYPPLEMLAEWRWLPCVARRAGWGQSSPDALSDSGHHSLTSPWGGTERESSFLGGGPCVCVCVCLYELYCGVPVSTVCSLSTLLVSCIICVFYLFIFLLSILKFLLYFPFACSFVFLCLHL